MCTVTCDPCINWLRASKNVAMTFVSTTIFVSFQVKIWFQNRRAKERKQNKKRDENQIIKMSSDLGDIPDESKQHVQQHMDMQMGTHAQHQVQVTSPSPQPMHGHNPYAYQGHGGQVHLSPQNALSPPQTHVNHQNQHYSSPNNLHLPISPGNDVTSTPHSCSVSPQPMAIKADIDANDVITTTPWSSRVCVCKITNYPVSEMWIDKKQHVYLFLTMYNSCK